MSTHWSTHWSWFVSTGATGYEVCVGSAPGQCELTGGWVAVGNATQWVVTPAMQSATTYWWQVRATNGTQTVMADGGQWRAFTTVNDSAPGAFGKLQPLQGATGVPTSGVTLRWQTSTGATGYQVCVGTQAGLCDVTGTWVAATGQSHVLSGLTPGTTYWWQVRAVSAAGTSQADAGAWWYFTTASASGAGLPGAFSKATPANNAANVATSTVLTWTASNNATGYQVCVGVLPGDCSVTGGSWASVNGTNYSPSGLQPGMTYWWQVRAVNGAGHVLANGGQWWTFTTANDPNAQTTVGSFGKVQPSHTLTNVAVNATLGWNAATNVQHYRVCVGTQPGLCDVMNVTTTLTNLTLVNAEPGTTYWWQVTAHNGGQAVQADGGQWWAFTVANATSGAPAAFNKTSPVSGTTSGSTVVFNWTASSAGVTYLVCVGTQWGLCDAVNNAGTSGTSLARTLPAGEYWWQVTAIDADGDATQADEGERWRLVVENSGVSLLDNPDTRKEVTPTVVRVGEVVSYTIVLSNTGNVTATVTVTDTPTTAPHALTLTVVGGTAGYSQSGGSVVWTGVIVPSKGTVVLTLTVKVSGAPLAMLQSGSTTLANSVVIEANGESITRQSADVTVMPQRVFAPIVRRP